MRIPRTLSPAATALAALLALGGCATPHVDMPETAPMPAVAMPAPAPAPANGSIFQGTTYRPLFEDHRARRPGDTLTVQIVEAVSASQTSSSAVDKSGAVDASVSRLPLSNATSPVLGRLTANASSSNTFAGAGATASSNDFSGTITAMVTTTICARLICMCWPTP